MIIQQVIEFKTTDLYL